MFNWISPHQSQQVKEALQGGREKQMQDLLYNAQGHRLSNPAGFSGARGHTR